MANTITYEAAAELTANFQTANPGHVKSECFPRAAYDELLAQDGCQGIRNHYGQSSDGTPHLVVCGTNVSGNDMTGLIMEMSLPCPTMCGEANNLNHNL